MAFVLEIREIEAHVNASPWDGLSRGTATQWEVEFRAGSQSLNLRIQDPLSSPLSASGAAASEETIAWYLEKHISEPFETTKAEAALETISSYGHDLASQIVQSGLLPKRGEIQLHIISSPSSQIARSGGSSGTRRLLQQLHWEILENVKLWPAGFWLKNVSVARSVTRTRPTISVPAYGDNQGTEKDVDYQLVAKCLVAIVDHVSAVNPDARVALKILRPPTWQAFREHLRDNDYDLVHFDTKGEIQRRKDGSANAVLEFCKPDLGNPLKMKKDLRTADEVGKELASAGVRTVVLNACNSASFRDSAPGTNLAEVLLGYGVHSVLAMAYKVVEEAVEVFMSAFYQALIANHTSVLDATRIGRSALLRNQSRRARYMHTVNLADYIVPVLYMHATESGESVANSAAGPSGILALVDTVLASLKQISLASRTTSGLGIDMKRGLLGRDYNILSLEVLLSVSRVVYLYGQGGVGKTELLHYVCEWWKSSGWIKGVVYIDFAGRGFRSVKDILEKVVEDLHLELDDPTQENVANMLRGGKYLLIFDSAEVFDTPVIIDRVSCSDSLRTELKDFVDAATAGESMVIVSSRLETTSVFSVPTERHKYRLPGLSVLDSVTLLQDLAFGPDGKVPEVFYRRDNIDALRRAAILLEGNPAAIRLIVRELKKVGYDGERLYYNMMYGVCNTHVEDEQSTETCRFLRTIYVALVVPSFIDFDKTMISATQFAPFWNIMPKDLNFYYWFLYLSVSKYFQEATLKTWVTKEFKDTVYDAQMARKLRQCWPEIENKMVQAGILTRATITRRDGHKFPCYHVHPIYTLAARAAVSENQWKEMRFAYIRQSLLWDPGYETFEITDWTGVEWEAAGPQHEDYLYNWRHIAIAWSVADGNLLEEFERIGASMLDCTYRLISGWDSRRHSRPLIPHIRAHLLQAHMIVDLLRPGRIPTSSDLHSILDFSWTLFRLEADDATQAVKSALVKSALDVFDRWEAASPPGEAVLSPPQEVSWFQLRHAEAMLAEDIGDLSAAKALYERNLRTDPMTTSVGMLNIIRRWHAQSIQNWSNCVVRMHVREGRIDSAMARKQLQGFVKEIMDVNPRDSTPWLMRLLTQHEADVADIRVRDQHAYALEKEAEAAAMFGSFARSILDGKMLDVFADVFPHGAAVSGIKELLVQAQRGGDPLAVGMQSEMLSMEFGLRMLAGDNTAAAGAIQPEIAREGLSSTTSNGWERLAEVHMLLYTLAVFRTEVPDYRKGLTHIQEWWKLHQGVGISKRDRCFGLLKFATCHHGLGRIADAARSVIKIMATAQTLTPADCVEGNVVGMSECLLLEIAKFDKLDVFLDPRVVFFRSDGLAELGLKEKVAMHQIVTRAKQTQKDKDEMDRSYHRLRETMKKARETLLRVKGISGGVGVDDMIAKLDKSLEVEVTKEPDYWLF